MSTMRATILITALLATVRLSAQTCDCPATFAWMVSTFEQNDAGFQFVLDRKGEEAFQAHTSAMRAKVQGVDALMPCSELLNQWLHFFRQGHIGIGPTEEAWQAGSSGAEAAAAVPQGRTVKLTEAQLVKRLTNTKARHHPLEGVWTMGAYRVGIVQQSADPTRFDAVILASQNKNWKPGEVKVELQQMPDGRFTGTFYIGDHSPQPVGAELVGESGGILSMRGAWTRQVPPVELTVQEQVYLRTLDAEEPFLTPLSERTLYLRIPSFAFEQKVLIDSVLAANDALIRNTDNLIIDIRNGTGGSDNSYANLIPYLYTGPIRTVGLQLRATELNASGFEEYAAMFGEGTESGEYCTRVARSMRENLGGWIDPSPEMVSVDSSHSTLPKPQRIGILINEGNGSTDEQFLLEARPSSKVKLFGHSTQGVLDISNMRILRSPDGLFELAYAMSKSYRIPHLAIDGVGIQPDHFLDAGIPDHRWVEYVQQVLER